MPKLTIQSGLQKGTEIAVRKSMVIGRGGAVDLSLADTSVSRRHASLTLQGGECFVEDLGSANGTAVNGRPARQKTKLRHGDVIGVGSVFVRFSDEEGAPAKGEAAPAVKLRDDGPQPSVLLAIPEEQKGAAAVDEKARLRFLDDFARISTLVFDEPALVSFVVDEMLELMPRADRAVVLIDQDGELVPRASRTRTGKNPRIVTSRRLLQDVMARREAVLAVDTQVDERYAQSDSIHELGIRAAICAPMLFQNQIYGVLQVDSATPGVPFGKSDLALVLSLASQIGMALGYARLHASLVERELLEHDMELARKIQQQFLPDGALEVPGYGIAVEYRPALAVGGDMYDAIDLGNGRTAFVVGDVSGKGVSAALLAAKLTTDLRYQSPGRSAPSDILARANQVLANRDNEGMFVTAAVAVLDPATGALDIASAGHPLPFVRDGAGAVAPLGRAGDAPLGIDPRARYSESSYQFEAGDTLVMYTDGVIEALNPANEVFGEARLIETIRRAPAGPEAIRRAIESDVERFVGGAPQSDDITILCLGRT